MSYPIEILVVRDPDSENDVRVWVDGRPAGHPDVVIIEVDAGAGWDYTDWVESAAEASKLARSEAFRWAVDSAYADPPGRRYIDGMPDDD